MVHTNESLYETERGRERGRLEKEKVLDFKESELCDSNRSRGLSDGYLATRG